eukprot:TRINITY_DN7520_c0_g1_i2.p1 TRINITY_DN7520_c0_g1~~TRINITY_DN7520_c0_g1_i2.p1  ORF type:complete len:181 (+),score=15.14 TRINITY_DN7520_c0_g1_i2:505-1047(+)
MRNEGESGERREVMVSTSAEIRTSARPWCLVSGEGMQIRVLAPRLVSQAAENEDNIRKVASLTHRLFAVTPSGGFLSSHSFPVGPGLWLALRHALTDLKREVVAGIYATHSTICIQPSHQLGAEVIDKKLRAELDSLAADDRVRGKVKFAACGSVDFDWVRDDSSQSWSSSRTPSVSGIV